MPASTYLKVSTTDPESAVLVGFESKLNVLGLCECGEAVVEFAYHIFESLPWFGIDPRLRAEGRSVSFYSFREERGVSVPINTGIRIMVIGASRENRLEL